LRGSEEMSTIVKMLGWSSKGLRCPDYSVTFEDNEGNIQPVTLIQMPNGTGKTTTLQLLRATLSGKAEYEKWGPELVRSYQKKNSKDERGEFQVVLEINQQRITFSLIFDFEEGSISSYTTSGNGKVKGFRPPREGKDFLNPDFIEFLVFDGELATQLLDSNHTDAEKAIEYLYKVKHFNSIKKVVEEHWENIVKNTKASDPKTQTRRENKVNFLNKRIAMLTSEKKAKEALLKEYQKEFDIITNKYEDKIREKDQHHNEFEEQKILLESAINEVKATKNSLLKDIRSPYLLTSVFGEEILELKRNLDKVKLPESTAKEFFQELSEEEVCVCGRELDEEHRISLRERASHYMGSDEMNFLNGMKSDISNHILDNPEKYEEKFKSDLKNFIQIIQERQKAKTDLAVIEEALTGGDSTIREAKEKKDKLDILIKNLVDDLQKYKDKDDSLDDDKTFGIDILHKRLEEAEVKLAEITKTVSLKKKSDLLNKILTQAHSEAMKDIIQNIKNDANDRIRELLPNNNIQISDINKALKLKGQEAGSVGETLSVAYAFMATLFSNTERELPFIVDSPANSIDNKVREEVANLIPNLTNQFIAFTISSERGSFVNPLDLASGGNVKYITIFRQGDTTLEEMARDSESSKYTDDGVMVYGKDFFWSFHKNEEEEMEIETNV
jgi:DNA sulfur modification protein DndD